MLVWDYNGMNRKKLRFSPSLCLTHQCNLDCIYCYEQHKDSLAMTFETAKNCIDWIFENVPKEMDGIEISLTGGEPLLEFELIKKIFEYVFYDNQKEKIILFATTNGTLLTNEMKEWFYEHREHFYLSLSLDGTRETHNCNRSNSFDAIDINFFRNTWPNQSVKMTLSEYSLFNLADNIKYIHSLGFNIEGANLFEGDFDWGKEKYINMLIPQLKVLVDFYVENISVPLNKMFDKRLDFCEAKNRPREKLCGIGTGAIFFDVNGKKYPCNIITPMTLSPVELKNISEINFADNNNFLDDYCFNNCYIYPICDACVGSNYIVNKNFSQRDKRKCRINELIVLFIADLQSKRILKNPSLFEKSILYYTIEAIKNIKEIYFNKFKEFF